MLEADFSDEQKKDQQLVLFTQTKLEDGNSVWSDNKSFEIKVKPAHPNWLKDPIGPRERRWMNKAYVDNQGLIRLLGSKLTAKYAMVDSLDVFSCIDVAFIKACRAYKASKGEFSTILTVYAEGEIKHFIRDHNFMITAPPQIREMSTAVRKLAAKNYTISEIAETLGTTTERIRECLIATTGVAHEQKHWEHHYCHRPTPLDVLIAEEERSAN